ncbi:MAG: sulfotransferase domain-containing protein [Acidimicrobiales bacterium]
MGELVRYSGMVFDSARWEGFEFRDDDIVICTPPKCGTTWTQMICAQLVLQTPVLGSQLDVLSPWLDMLLRSREDVVSDLDAQTHRRFIKTHTPLDGIPFDDRVTYIAVGRDMRDVGMSWDNHLGNLDMEAFIGARAQAVGLDDIADLIAAGGPPPPAESLAERFWTWVDDDGTSPMGIFGGLQGFLYTIDTYWGQRDKPNVTMLRYEDLLSDLSGQMRLLAGRLGIDVPEDRWPSLVEAATFANMKAASAVTTPERNNKIWKDESQFFHKGTAGQWRDLFGPGDETRFRKRVDECASPELAAWLHEPSGW